MRRFLFLVAIFSASCSGGSFGNAEMLQYAGDSIDFGIQRQGCGVLTRRLRLTEDSYQLPEVDVRTSCECLQVYYKPEENVFAINYDASTFAALQEGDTLNLMESFSIKADSLYRQYFVKIKLIN